MHVYAPTIGLEEDPAFHTKNPDYYDYNYLIIVLYYPQTYGRGPGRKESCTPAKAIGWGTGEAGDPTGGKARRPAGGGPRSTTLKRGQPIVRLDADENK